MSRLTKNTKNIIKNLNRTSVAYKAIRTCYAGHILRPSTVSTKQALLNIEPTKMTVLDNGVRVATENNGSQTATVGVYIDVGSRSENQENNGISHFLEHMAFKGTNKRSQNDLVSEVENMGAKIHSYTTKEQTTFYAKCLSQDASKALDILADISVNSKMGEAEIDKERSVILNQLSNVEADKKQFIMNHLHTVAFQGTSLQYPVIGSAENIQSLKRDDLIRFRDTYYQPGSIVVAGAGGVNHDQLVEQAQKSFGHLKQSFSEEISGKLASRYTGSDVEIVDETLPLCYISVVQEGAGIGDTEEIPLTLASLLVGSFDKSQNAAYFSSSVLRKDSCYMNFVNSFESFHIQYRETGLWGMYFVAPKAPLDDFRWNFTNEWKRICINPTDFEVERAKNKLRTSLLLNAGNTTATCEDIGKQVLFKGRREPVSELDEKIQAVDADEVKEVVYKHVYDRCPAFAAYGKIDQDWDYMTIRSCMNWVRV